MGTKKYIKKLYAKKRKLEEVGLKKDHKTLESLLDAIGLSCIYKKRWPKDHCPWRVVRLGADGNPKQTDVCDGPTVHVAAFSSKREILYRILSEISHFYFYDIGLTENNYYSLDRDVAESQKTPNPFFGLKSYEEALLISEIL